LRRLDRRRAGLQRRVARETRVLALRSERRQTARARVRAHRRRRRRRLTYSIVARDPATGELGVAVQSHWFSVGSVVPWAEPGVGAVATQSIAEPAYGPGALDLMRGGASAPDALHKLLEADDDRAVRQVAVVDSHGRAAVHSGRP